MELPQVNLGAWTPFWDWGSPFVFAIKQLDALYPIDYIVSMFSIKPLPEFSAWLDGLKDVTVRGAVVARLKRLEFGLFGDVEPTGDGVSELRIHIGAG